jgi:GntR family transcriptional regulator / MocR family aminotransferase
MRPLGQSKMALRHYAKTHRSDRVGFGTRVIAEGGKHSAVMSFPIHPRDRRSSAAGIGSRGGTHPGNRECGHNSNSRMTNYEVIDSFALRPRTRGTPLFRWLYEEIRAAIVEGRFPPGSRLPSRAALARKYRVSMGTVIAAFERLLNQGYVDASVGRGTFVRAALPDALLEPGAPRACAPTPSRRRSLSARGRLFAAQPFPELFSNRSVETFRMDCSMLDAFPIDTWNRLVARRMSGDAQRLTAHGEPLGFPPLRAAIAEYLADTRGVRCTASQVVVTSGTQESLDLVARLLLDPDDRVWMEDPGYAAATSLLRAHGAEVVAVPVDNQGIDSDVGRQRSERARLAYVTPACQFPLGVPMSLERRVKLLQWANAAGAWIFEDDYDGPLHFEGQSPSPLFSLDRARSVIYSGSFNRTLFSSLRLGFLILPPAFIDSAAAALSITRRYHPTLDQAVLADFIAEGHLKPHLHRMREIYSARRQALIEACRTELGGLMRCGDSPGGLQIVGWLAPGMSETAAWARAAARGIESVALSSLTLARRMPPGLVFGIAGANPYAIRTAVRRLGRVLRVLAWQETGSSAPLRLSPVALGSSGHASHDRQVVSLPLRR